MSLLIPFWQPSGVSWVKHLPRLNSTVIAYNDRFYRARLQALQAVDEIVEGVITHLHDAGILDNTYVIFSTDNGFHISQHRLPPGKTCGYEEDINIPLIIRGPGVPKGSTTDIVTAHTDLAPTFLKLAGALPRPDFDGTAIPTTASELLEAESFRQEHVNVEFWGRAIPEGIYGFSVDDGKIRKRSPIPSSLSFHLESNSSL
jgi:N-acetylglucosamine-6-sulfatase